MLAPAEVLEETDRYLNKKDSALSDETVKSAIRAALFAKNLRVLPDIDNKAIVDGTSYYVRVLAARKDVIPSQLPQLVVYSRRIAMVSVAMAKKSAGNPAITDEVLVSRAFLMAATTARPVYVITADKDIAHQSYKLASLLWEDYISGRFAEFYSQNQHHKIEQIPLRDIPGADLYCVPGESFAVSRAGFDAYSSVKFPASPFNLWMVTLTPLGGADVVAFNVPPCMESIFETKGETGGLNTKLFVPLNCYIGAGVVNLFYEFYRGRSDAPYALFLRDIAWKETTISAVDWDRSMSDGEPPQIELHRIP